MKESIRKIQKILEETIETYGLNSCETMKWSILMNQLMNIDEKLKKYTTLKSEEGIRQKTEGKVEFCRKICNKIKNKYSY